MNFDDSDLIMEVASRGGNLLVFYFLSVCEILPDKLEGWTLMIVTLLRRWPLEGDNLVVFYFLSACEI
jgi:hypothetical protein